MRKPIETVVRIRGIDVQPIESLSWATERKVRCHFYTRCYYAQFKTQVQIVQTTSKSMALFFLSSASYGKKYSRSIGLNAYFRELQKNTPKY